jgi:hypothetical protein
MKILFFYLFLSTHLLNSQLIFPSIPSQLPSAPSIPSLSKTNQIPNITTLQTISKQIQTLLPKQNINHTLQFSNLSPFTKQMLNIPNLSNAPNTLNLSNIPDPMNLLPNISSTNPFNIQPAPNLNPNMSDLIDIELFPDDSLSTIFDIQQVPGAPSGTRISSTRRNRIPPTETSTLPSSISASLNPPDSYSDEVSGTFDEREEQQVAIDTINIVKSDILFRQLISDGKQKNKQKK